MATLTSSYQYLGRSSVMTSVGGTLSYYLLLYAKTSANQTTGIHTVTIKEVLASVNDGATFYYYNTTHSGTVGGKTAFSGTNEPRDAWELGSFTEGGVTYKTGTVIGEGSATVDATDGTAKTVTLTCSWKMNDTADSYTPANGTTRTVSVSATLAAIPRYLTITTLEITSKTETSVVVKWGTSDSRSGTYYSFDNGTTWIGSATDGETLGSDGKSGTFNILNLTANTTYNLKVKFKRTNTDLWTESSVISFTTYNYPYCIATPDFTIGSALTLNLYNPLNRNVAVTGYAKSTGNAIFYGNTTGTILIGFNDSNSVNTQYGTIPNSQSGAYYVVVTYGSITKTTNTGNVYKIKGDEVPTINSFDYTDNNASTVAITGNNQQIVQNKSTLVARVGAATPNKSAGSITKYVVSCNGKTAEASTEGNFTLGGINSGSNVNLTLTVTDSRGLSSSKTIAVTMIPHADPTAVVTLSRLNNYEDTSYLTVDGVVSSVNGKNQMAIQYRYKVSGGTYNSFVTIPDATKQTLSLDKSKVYLFNIVVTDSFGAKYDREHTLGKGVFPLFIDTGKNSVGMNRFPTNQSSLEIDGLVSASSMKCKNLLYTPYTESNKYTLTAERSDHYVFTWYYCHLEKGKTYTFSCQSDGTWGSDINSDTVEVYLMKDKGTEAFFAMNQSPKTFTVTVTGTYYVRFDVNKTGCTHSFWNLQVEEGKSASAYVEAKQFEYQDQYFLSEHKVGYWISGKPLYRKVVSLEAGHFGTAGSTVGKSIQIAHNIKNIQDVVKIDSVWLSDGLYRAFPTNYYGTAEWDGQFYCTKTDLWFELGAGVYNRIISATTYFYVTLYYTKTTD